MGDAPALQPGGRRRAAWWFAVGIVLATLANGAYAYLARLGQLDRAHFHEFVSLFCDRAPERIEGPLALSCRCMRVHPEIDYSKVISPVYLYHTDGWRLLLKLPKEALFAALLLVSLAWRPRLRPSSWRRGDVLVVGGFAAVLAMGVLFSLANRGPIYAALGLRPFEFVAVAALASWAAPFLRDVAKPLLALLAIQACLVVPEMLFAMPIRTCPNSFRAAGTLVLPNSLGIVAALLLAFAAAFRPEALRSPWPWLAGACVVLAGGSGAGIVLMFLTAMLQAWRIVPPERRRMLLGAGAAIALVLVFALPLITQRPQIYDSLFGLGGRSDKVAEVWQASTPVQRVFGEGMGYGTNMAINLVSAADGAVREAYLDTNLFYADSTVTSFLEQFGLLGPLAWIALMCWAAWRDPVARPFYIVFAVASLVINIPELFPANLMLGLALAHTFVRVGLAEPRA